MKNFENLKSMSIDELAEWLDKNGMWDNSPWSKWFDSTYCQRCESVKATVEDDFGKRECEFAWCELENKCRYFPDRDDVPDCKEIVKMWLEAIENTCPECKDWKYERLWIGYKFCPYCGRKLTEDEE